MTNNDTLILAFARAMIDNCDADAMLDMHLSLRTRLSPADYSTLSYALELCPLHNCDAQICRDDARPDCAAAIN